MVYFDIKVSLRLQFRRRFGCQVFVVFTPLWENLRAPAKMCYSDPRMLFNYVHEARNLDRLAGMVRGFVRRVKEYSRLSTEFTHKNAKNCRDRPLLSEMP